MSGPAPRPTNWLIILGATGGAVLLGFFSLRLFWLPLQQSNRTLLVKQDEYDREERDYLLLRKERKRLEAYRLRGLPHNLEKGGTDYARYFQDMLRECGLTVEDFQGPNGLDARNQSSPRDTKKKPGHTVLSFLVRATGQWGGLVKLLEKFQRTPLLHRLKSWSVEQAVSSKESAPGKLVMNMTIETLVVGHNKQRADDLWGVDPRCVALDGLLALRRQPAGWALLLRGQALLAPEMPPRGYAVLARVNPFAGGLSMGERPGEVPRDKNAPDARPTTYLVLTDHAAQQAILLAEMKERYSSIHLGAAGAHDTFEIWDGRQQMKGKVLRVAPRDVYFRVGGEVYGMHVGQNLADAMYRPLSPRELRELGLVGK